MPAVRDLTHDGRLSIYDVLCTQAVQCFMPGKIVHTWERL
jgi:hypothetical protein